MKTIGYQDRAGGSIHIYKNVSKPDQKRHERTMEALNELRHTGNINIYLIKGNRIRKIAKHGM
jgi:hypothetical protein